jgi:hypothetical protein
MKCFRKSKSLEALLSVSYVARLVGLFVFGLLLLPAVASAADGCSGVSDSVDVTTLIGKCADETRTMPSFKALSHDGTLRSKKDLMGHPTVIWFFPVAGTPG